MDRERRHRAEARPQPPGAGRNAADEMQALAKVFAAGNAARPSKTPWVSRRSILVLFGVALIVIAVAGAAVYFPLRRAQARDAYDHGQRLMTVGKYREAIVYFDRATGLNSNFADAAYARALAYTALGQDPKVLPDLNRVVDLRPDFAEAYFHRAAIYNRRGEFERAIKDLAKVIALKPEYGPAYALRGAVYRSLGDYQQAISDYTRAIQAQPAVDNYFDRASVYAKIGENRKALIDLNDAIALKPTVYFLYLSRANIRSALGDRAGYAADRRKAKELEATH